jgi:hypothetical protein
MRNPLGNDIQLGRKSGEPGMLTLPADARDKHVYICGATGSGKSKLLESLIRQDITNWNSSQCGMLLLDPHGSLYDSLLRWLAWHPQLASRPIIPIDLRRDDQILAYNVLRPRQASAAVVVETFVEAMAYTWGARSTDQTPLFARWASNTMRALYEKGYTLAEAQYLTDRQNQHLRQVMTANLTDEVCGRDWAYANALSPKDFDAQIGSTLNRLGRFLRNEHMRAMFGQATSSLDLGRALNEGAIILVSLAREGGRVSKEDTDLFATLLLSDLWTAAQERGKHAGAKPFYVYMDEAQRFITPTIAENLDEARGFGLHLTLANQFPGQFLTRGDSGKQLYDSVMENATTKVVFRLGNEENLKPMAQWLFRGTMDPDEVKLKLYSTKVMDYRTEMRESYSTGKSSGKGGGKFAGHSSGHGAGTGLSSSETGDILNQQESSQDSLSDAAGESESWSEGTTETVTRTPTLMPIMGQEISQVQYRSLDEQLFRAMAALFEQRQRHCVARIGDRMPAPVRLEVPTIQDPPTPPARLERYLAERYRAWPFFLPMHEAVQCLEHRSALLLESLLQGDQLDEPTTAKRRLPPE